MVYCGSVKRFEHLGAQHIMDPQVGFVYRPFRTLRSELQALGWGGAGK